MTNDRAAFCQLVEKSSDADLLREMIALAAERLTGADYGERSPERLAQPNGYRKRDWRPAPGRSSCACRAQEGQLLPGLPGAASGGREGADGSVQEAYVQGISLPRSIGPDPLDQPLGGRQRRG